MRLTFLAIVGLSAVLLTACTGKMNTAVRTGNSESEVVTDPTTIGTSAEIEADTTIQVPALKDTDDVSSIKADLDATVVTEESF